MYQKLCLENDLCVKIVCSYFLSFGFIKNCQMQIDFVKYHATGNDFILIDNTSEKYNGLSARKVTQLCHRRFGIGADGVILIEKHSEWDFMMNYYNSDGKIGTFCGNGSRAAVHFGRQLGL